MMLQSMNNKPQKLTASSPTIPTANNDTSMDSAPTNQGHSSSQQQGLHANQQLSSQLSAQQTTQSMLLRSQSLLLRSHPQSQQASGTHHPQQLGLQQNVQQRLPVSDQQRQLQHQSQRTLPEMPSSSLDSAAQEENANGDDWQEEVFQNIKAMKEKYFTHLMYVHKRFVGILQQDSPPRQLENIKRSKMMLERVLDFLSMSKSTIGPTWKDDDLASRENFIISLLKTDRSGLAALQRQLAQSQMQHMHQPQSQTAQVQSHDSQTTLHKQSVSMHGYGKRAQQGSLTNTQQGISKQGQHATYHLQQLKSGTQIPVTSRQLMQSASPQTAQQNLSPQVDKMGTPLQPLHTMQVDSEKPSGASSPSVGNIPRRQATDMRGVVQSLDFGSASPLQEVTSSNNLLREPSETELPIERLIRAVKSISPEALSSAISNIISVTNMVDRIAGSAPGNGSRSSVGEDLFEMTKCRLQARNFMTQEGMMVTLKRKRHTTAMPLSVDDNYKQFVCSETSDAKKARSEDKHALFEEIKEINQRLIDTVIEISNEPANRGSEGTTVRISFIAVSLSMDLKAHLSSTQTSLIQPLHLLIPCSYPNDSPSLLDKLPFEHREKEGVSSKAMARFNILLKSLSLPMSLKEMAYTWDACARAVICEYAQQFGGDTFSSKYGAWEKMFVLSVS